MRKGVRSAKHSWWTLQTTRDHWGQLVASETPRMRRSVWSMPVGGVAYIVGSKGSDGGAL